MQEKGVGIVSGIVVDNYTWRCSKMINQAENFSISLLLLTSILLFPLAAASPYFMPLPPLGAISSVVDVLWMYPSVLRWTTFDVLYAELIFRLRSLIFVIFLVFLLV